MFFLKIVVYFYRLICPKRWCSVWNSWLKNKTQTKNYSKYPYLLMMKCSAWFMYHIKIIKNDNSKPILNKMNHYVDCDNIMKRWRIKFVFKISLSPPNLIYKSPLHDCWSSFVSINKYFPGSIFISCVFYNILENDLIWIVIFIWYCNTLFKFVVPFKYCSELFQQKN